ncbi:hypothetical protein L1987_87508 [Smallanthus sonchifolius]|nr:hypothetical protein L1987_87508 [Smallanthus sonchifolius]
MMRRLQMAEKQMIEVPKESCFQLFRQFLLNEDFVEIQAPKLTAGTSEGYSRTRNLESEELSEQLPSLQQLLYRLM